MPVALSVYFDFVRLSAALVVLLSHAWPAFLPRHPLPWPGHHAVVVFFVLSGYVIAFVTDTKERQLRIYAVNRLVRILSVTIPALALTLAVSIVAMPEWRDQMWRLLLDLFFLGENWSTDAWPSANPPYWSLCYEVWYYAIFAGFFFPRNPIWKVLSGGALALLAGPKILLLMPCWLLGAAIYRFRRSIRLTDRAATALFFGSLALWGIFYWWDVSIVLREWLKGFAPEFVASLNASNQFMGDTILALIVSGNFVAMFALAPRLTKIARNWRKPIGAGASCTLSLYLYHFPSIVLLTHFHVAAAPGIALAIAIPLALAPLTELRRTALRDWVYGRIGHKPGISKPGQLQEELAAVRLPS